MTSQQKYQWRLVGLKELLQEQIITKSQFDRKCYENQLRFLGSAETGDVDSSQGFRQGINPDIFRELQSGGYNLRHVETVDRTRPQLDPHRRLMEELGTSHPSLSLRRAETHDRSQPYIEPELKIGKNPHSSLMQELLHSNRELSSVVTYDRSNPYIDPSVQIGTATHKNVFEELKAGKAVYDHKRLMRELSQTNPSLKHAETRDTSVPYFEEENFNLRMSAYPVLFRELQAAHELRPVQTVDKSAPYIDPSIRIGEAPQKKILEDIKTGKTAFEKKKVLKELDASAPSLKHVETVDKSIPYIDPEIQIQRSNRPDLYRELLSERQLKHVEIQDRSFPYIDPNIRIGEAPQKKIFEELKAGKAVFDQRKVVKELDSGSHSLKHVETVDRSGPYIEPDVHITPSLRPELYREIQQTRELKHVETQDRSAPYIDPNVRLREAYRNQLFEELRLARTEFDRNKLLKEIAFAANPNFPAPELKHVETQDRSYPYIDPNTQIQFSGRPLLFRELQNINPENLRPVETYDRSGAYLDPTVHIGEAPHKKVFEQLAAGKHVFDQRKVLRELNEQKTPLKHVEVQDRSGPYIDPNVRIGEAPHKKIFEEISQFSENPQLKHVEVQDKSAPYIDPNVRIGEAPQKKIFEELKAGKAVVDQKRVVRHLSSGTPPDLRHIETIDKSSPYIESDVRIGKSVHPELMREILRHQDLHSVVSYDRSAPYIDPSVHIRESYQKQLLQELLAGKSVFDQKKLLNELGLYTPENLQHVETVDKSTPYIDPDVHIGEAPHKKLFSEIPESPVLKHVETADKSAPFIDPSIQIGEAPHKKVLEEIKIGKAVSDHKKIVKEVSENPPELKHAETIDKSTPVIDPEVKIGEAPQKKVFEEILNPPSLKHVETEDKSAPVIDPETHIGEAPQKKVFEELKAKSVNNESGDNQ